MYSAIGIGPAMRMSLRISVSSGEISSAIFRLGFAAIGVRKYGYTDQHQWNAQKHSHGEAAPEKTKLHVGLAEEFAGDARDPVANAETSGDHARPFECT